MKHIFGSKILSYYALILYMVREMKRINDLLSSKFDRIDIYINFFKPNRDKFSEKEERERENFFVN